MRTVIIIAIAFLKILSIFFVLFSVLITYSMAVGIERDKLDRTDVLTWVMIFFLYAGVIGLLVGIVKLNKFLTRKLNDVL